MLTPNIDDVEVVVGIDAGDNVNDPISAQRQERQSVDAHLKEMRRAP